MLKCFSMLFFPIFLFAHFPIVPIPTSVTVDMKKAILGKKLFFDTLLSKDNTISCSSCHTLPGSGANTTPYSFGVAGVEGDFNSPTVLNSGYNFVQFWNGRAKDLQAQVLHPLINPTEMANTLDNIILTLKNSLYNKEFASIYEDGVTVANLSEVIAEFEKALITPNSRFDKFLRGDVGAINAQEKRGYKVFKKLGCISCHNGMNVGANVYQKIGLIIPYPQDKLFLGRYDVTLRERDKHVYKVPTLRNIALSAPYFHDGQVKTLHKAIQNMQKYQLGIEPEQQNTNDIEAFLRTLTGDTPAILQELQ